MLAIVGKAKPNDATGEIEYFLSDFRQMIRQQGQFVYAWSFNPDEAAIAHMRHTLDQGDDVFLYLPGDRGLSALRMRITDFQHNRAADGTPCPPLWVQNCVEGLRDRRALGTTPSIAIHVWFLVSAIEDLAPPVDLLRTFAPVFRAKYERWGRNFFAFLRHHEDRSRRRTR
jgi:hypothetical protein